MSDEQQRVQRIKQYVLARLREELADAPRGGQARLAKKLEVSGAHLSNMLSTNPTRQPGEDFRRKAAVHWGLSYAQLEALALGEEPPSSSTKPTSSLPPSLATAVEDYDWQPELPPELRTLVREQARMHHVYNPNEVASDEWQHILNGLEREALALLERRGPVRKKKGSR